MTKEIRDRAVVIKSEESGESDRLLTLFCLENGKIRAKIRGVKKPRAKLAFASMPFCFAEYILSKKGVFFSVINANPIDNFFEITHDLNKFYAGGIVLEVLSHLSREGEGNSEVFVLALSTLKTLAYSTHNAMLVIAKFLYDAVRIAGYEINTQICKECGESTNSNLFSLDSGCFVCAHHSGISYVKLSRASALVLRNIESEDFLNNEKNASGIKNILKLLGFYFEDKIGERIDALKVFV